MTRLLYSILFYLALPFITFRLLYRARKAPEYKKRMKERFGLGLKHLQPGGIWVHAVSVGETIAAAPMINALLKYYPELPVTVTCMTPTGSKQIQQLFGSRVQHCYMPYDAACIAKHFIKKLQPKLFIIMETELWPNHCFYCHQMNIPVILANARLSERSAKRYAKLPHIVKPMLSSLSWIATQSEVEAERFITLGAQPDRVSVIGSIKFDININQTLIDDAVQLRQVWQTVKRPTWIAASTHEGEDEVILEVHRQLLIQFPETLLILVPRHPERFDTVVKLSEQHFKTIRRSKRMAITKDTQVLVGDTMGELLFLYALADVAFVGGSLVEHGGHNLLEPVALNKPVVAGPHLFNFQEISNQLVDEQALIIVNSAQELFLQLKRLMDKKEVISQMIQGGEKVMQRNQGALQLLLEGVNKQLTMPYDKT